MSTLSSREMVMVDLLCKSVCGCWMGRHADTASYGTSTRVTGHPCHLSSYAIC